MTGDIKGGKNFLFSSERCLFKVRQFYCFGERQGYFYKSFRIIETVLTEDFRSWYKLLAGDTTATVKFFGKVAWYLITGHIPSG